MEGAAGRETHQPQLGPLVPPPGPQPYGAGIEAYAGTHGHGHPGKEEQARQRGTQMQLFAHLGLFLPKTLRNTRETQLCCPQPFSLLSCLNLVLTFKGSARLGVWSLRVERAKSSFSDLSSLICLKPRVGKGQWAVSVTRLQQRPDSGYLPRRWFESQEYHLNLSSRCLPGLAGKDPAGQD